MPTKYAYFVNKKFQEVNTTCKLYIKETFYSQKTDTHTLYGYCIHKQCKKFKIIFDSVSDQHKENITVSVYSISLNFNHLHNLTSQVRGLERKTVGNSLVNSKPLKKRQDDTLALDKQSLSLGNYGKVKSDYVYRKIRSEQLAKNDRHGHDFYDLIELQGEHPEYIKSVGSPFYVHVCSQEQISLLRNLTDVTLHLDATGSIIKNPWNQNKRVYYYAGVIQVPSTKRICPIFEMVTSSHDAASLSCWLFSFKTSYLNSKNTWPVFKRVVVDFSFAFINAVVLSFNNTDLLNYMQTTFEAVQLQKTLPTNYVIISICCFHAFRLMSNLIVEFYPKEIHKIMKEVHPLSSKIVPIITTF